jgi:hypothetical protein
MSHSTLTSGYDAIEGFLDKMRNATKKRIPARSRLEFADPAIARVFDTYAPAVKPKLLALRRLILDTAAATPGAGELKETLKWGQPSYLTTQTKAGSTIRIDHIKSEPAQYAMFFHCQTSLVETFRELYGRELTCLGNRSIVFHADDEIPEQALRHCVALALTYHLKKRTSARAT